MKETIEFIWYVAGIWAVLMLLAMLVLPKRTSRKNRFVMQATNKERCQDLTNKIHVLQEIYKDLDSLSAKLSNLRQQNRLLDERMQLVKYNPMIVSAEEAAWWNEEQRIADKEALTRIYYN